MWEIIKDITDSKIETSIVENSELMAQIIDFIVIIHKVSLDELPRKKKIGDKKAALRKSERSKTE